MSGKLYDCPQEWELTERINLSIQKEKVSGLWKLEQDIDIVQLNNKRTWAKSIEPEKHIKEMLDMPGLSLKDEINILCFSYKDYVVVQELKKRGRKYS